MSGPKSYAPPPTYSVKVFKGKLNILYNLQSEVTGLFHELGNLHIRDTDRGISLDCGETIARLEKQKKLCLESFVIEYAGRFGQETYNEFDQKIQSRIETITSLKTQVQEAKNNFLDQKEDYERYVSYDQYFENAFSSLNEFRNKTLNYLESQSGEKEKNNINLFKGKLKKIKPTSKKVSFKTGFQHTETAVMEKLKAEIREKEEEIYRIKNEAIHSLLHPGQARTGASGISQESPGQKHKGEIKQFYERILQKIEKLNDRTLQKKFTDELLKLKESEVFNDVYYYKEFYDQVARKEKTLEHKVQIKKIIFQLNSSPAAQSLLPEKNRLLKSALELLESGDIKSHHWEDIKSGFQTYLDQNNKILKDNFIRKKENEFLKAQLVKALQSMNYEVMDDMEVIDFEKESEFLLKAPGQTNYISLRVNEDHSIRYNFMMEEKGENLSIEQKQEKLIDMEKTCRDFKEVLSDLKKMGLSMDQTMDNPVNETTLMQLPQKYQEKIVKKQPSKKPKTTETRKQRYMNK